MDLYGPAYRHLLYPLWETGLRRRPTLQHLAHLERSQWFDLPKLEALQVEALGRLLRHAFDNVPYYRAQFLNAGVRPDSIRCAADLSRLPILGREQASDTITERTATSGPRVEVHKQTSGTMGRPLVFGYELESEYKRHAMKMRGYSWAGYRLGQRSLHYWGGRQPTGAHRPTLRDNFKSVKVQLDRALRREHYVDCGRRGPEELAAVVDIIRRERPRMIVCYAQAGADLARYVVERNLREWDTIPVICGAERVLPADHALLEQAFGPAIFDTYGSREVMLMAAECPAHSGLHVSMENLVIEVIVRDSAGGDRPARPGEVGEVVVTDLTNWAMPFIRYANGDLAVPADGGVCSCGRALPRLASIEGRVTETLRDGKGARVNGLIFNVVIAQLAYAIRQFQVVQHRDGSVTLRVVPTSSFDTHVESVLRETWEQYLPGVPVVLDRVQEILVSPSGKRQVVVVER